MKLVINIKGNTQFRRILDKLANETESGERLSLDCLVYIKIHKSIYKEVIPEDIPGNHNKDWSQFFTAYSKKNVNMRYVAIGRTKKAYRNDKVLTGGYEEVEPWRFWRWVDYIGIENTFVDIPQLEETEEEVI